MTEFKKGNITENYSDHIRIVMLGKTGSGKSASGNTFIGNKAFESKISASSITASCSSVVFKRKNKNIMLLDTPGLYDTKKSDEEILDELKKLMEYTYPGPHAFILVVTATRFTPEEQNTINIVSNFFGKSIFNHSIILFTRLDDLESDGLDIKSFLDNSDNEHLKSLIIKCNGNYMAINNKASLDKKETYANQILEMVEKIISKSPSPGYYTAAAFHTAQKFFEEEKKRLEQEVEDAERRKKEIDELIAKTQQELEEAKRRLEKAMEEANKSWLDKLGNSIANVFGW